jgi:hypothetical protein
MPFWDCGAHRSRDISFSRCLQLQFAILLARAINQRMEGHSFLRFVYVGLMIVGSVLVIQVIAR